MCANSSPSSATSSYMGWSEIRYFSFLTRWTFDAPLNLGFTYAGVQVISASLWDSIAGRSPLCHRDCLMEVIPKNLTVFGGVVITIVAPPYINL